MDEMDVSDAPMGDHEDKKFLKSLECPICKDILKEPKMLKCYHFFCKKCLYSTERARRDLGSTTTHDHEIDSFACGVCRQVTQLQELANVPMVNHILEEYRRNKSQDTTCGWCEDRDSSYRCIECKMIYCEPCKAKHDGIRDCQSHTCIDINSNGLQQLFSSKKVYCQVHRDEVCKFNCKQCKKMVCIICVNCNSDHREHCIESIEDALQLYKPKSQETVDQLTQRRKKYRDEKIRLNSIHQNLGI